MREYTGIIPEIKELLALRHYADRLPLFSNQLVNSSQVGNRLSRTRGRGMDFEEVRHYQPGDDIRLIHWPVTARLGKPFTKIYREEHERSILLLIDQSISMQFGTRVCFKTVIAAKLAALLGWAALGQHEQIGGMVFNNVCAEFIKPKRSRKSLLDIFNLLTNPHSLRHQEGGLNNTLKYVLHNLQSGSIVIVISDYLAMDDDTETYLRLIAQKSKLINCFIYDPLEETLPKTNNSLLSFTDGKLRLNINSSKKNNELYRAPFLKRIQRVKSLSDKNKMQFIKLATNDDLVTKINRRVMNHGQ